MKKYFWLLLFSFLLILGDQLLKIIFLTNSACNKYIAWSIQIAPGFFYASWIIIFSLLIFFLLRSKRQSEKIALVVMLSGALSNVLDRVIHGCVVDFIDLKFWPVFNLADIYITIGVIILAIKIIKNKSREATT